MSTAVEVDALATLMRSPSVRDSISGCATVTELYEACKSQLPSIEYDEFEHILEQMVYEMTPLRERDVQTMTAGIKIGSLFIQRK